MLKGRDVAQKVSRRPVHFVAGDWVLSQAGSYGFFGAPNGTGTGFTGVRLFCPSFIISPMPHNDLRLNTTRIRRTSGRSLRTFNHSSGFLTSGSNEQKRTVLLLFKF